MIVNDVIESGFDCYAIGPFRTLNTDEVEILLNTKKFRVSKFQRIV